MAMSETSRTPLPHAAPRGFLAAAASQHGGLITAFFLMALIVPFLGSYWIKNFTSMIAVAIAAQGVALRDAGPGDADPRTAVVLFYHDHDREPPVLAEALVSPAFYVGAQGIQLHGGIGVTDEYVVSHYFRRLTQMEMTFGDTLHHLGEVSQRMTETAGVFA